VNARDLIPATASPVERRRRKKEEIVFPEFYALPSSIATGS
jgi:hypothetical protein